MDNFLKMGGRGAQLRLTAPIGTNTIAHHRHVRDDASVASILTIPRRRTARRIALALVGTAIAGQTFYNFTLENLKQFGALKAMGATTGRS